MEFKNLRYITYKLVIYNNYHATSKNKANITSHCLSKEK